MSNLPYRNSQQSESKPTAPASTEPDTGRLRGGKPYLHDFSKENRKFQGSARPKQNETIVRSYYRSEYRVIFEVPVPEYRVLIEGS